MMFYFMELPDTKPETLNRAFAFILNKFPWLTDGLHKCATEQQQMLINCYPVHSLKWSSGCKWLGWGGPRVSNEVVIPFPSKGVVIGVL